ncbi:MAG TPA: alpha/beta fold hydrolase, partial [Bacteroidia bacterium]|nr:alpha/beta fold hydrolase [Bacteroidia bacterium]
MNVIEVKDRNRTLSIAVEDTGDVHSDTEASKPVLFFVHGLALDHVLWKYAIEYLRADFRCIAIDLPGHGASAGQRPEQAGNFTMSFYAGIVRSCIEKLGLKDVTLAGHSMGAQISIITALQIPSLVQRLVLVSPAGIEKFIPEEAAKIEVGTEMLYRAPMDVKHILGMYAPQMNVHAERARELANDHI